MTAVSIDAAKLTAIVVRIQAGDMQGLEDLHVRFEAVIKHILMRRIGLDWEEQYSEVLYTVFTGIRKNGMRNPAALPGMVATIANRTAIGHTRRQNRNLSIEALQEQRTGSELPPHLERKLASKQRTPEQEFVSSEEIAWMHWGLQQMGQFDQDILRRFYVNGQSIEQIRAELNLTDTQFRLRKCRAKAHLVQIIRKKLNGKRQSEKSDKTEFAGNVLAA
jgi:DNA-directed RNA polymerase specialized sigma24 family protein